MNERPIPAAALRDKNATEMLRVWIAEGKLHCSLNLGMYQESGKFSEPEAWGVILADVVRHVAAAMKEGYGATADKTIEEMVKALSVELEKPTSPREGSFVSF